MAIRLDPWRNIVGVGWPGGLPAGWYLIIVGSSIASPVFHEGDDFPAEEPYVETPVEPAWQFTSAAITAPEGAPGFPSLTLQPGIHWHEIEPETWAWSHGFAGPPRTDADYITSALSIGATTPAVVATYGRSALRRAEPTALGVVTTFSRAGTARVRNDVAVGFTEIESWYRYDPALIVHIDRLLGWHTEAAIETEPAEVVVECAFAQTPNPNMDEQPDWVLTAGLWNQPEGGGGTTLSSVNALHAPGAHSATVTLDIDQASVSMV